MDILKALKCLRKYTKNNISNNEKLNQHDDNGCRALILLCQTKFKYNLGLVSVSSINSLRDAVFASYDYDKIEELSERKYVADILFKRNFDTEFYVNSIRNLLSKGQEKPLTLIEKYEITHLCWCLIMIGEDNYIIHQYKYLVVEALKFVYLSSINEDVGTESLYFISLVWPEEIKRKWIIELGNSQNKNGCFPGQSEEEQTHHTGLVLLTLYNYYGWENINTLK